jgi:hypothetical protein
MQVPRTLVLLRGDDRVHSLNSNVPPAGEGARRADEGAFSRHFFEQPSF